jgi:hypothetical protein
MLPKELVLEQEERMLKFLKKNVTDLDDFNPIPVMQFQKEIAKSCLVELFNIKTATETKPALLIRSFTHAGDSYYDNCGFPEWVHGFPISSKVGRFRVCSYDIFQSAGVNFFYDGGVVGSTRELSKIIKGKFHSDYDANRIAVPLIRLLPKLHKYGFLIKPGDGPYRFNQDSNVLDFWKLRMF